MSQTNCDESPKRKGKKKGAVTGPTYVDVICFDEVGTVVMRGKEWKNRRMEETSEND